MLTRANRSISRVNVRYFGLTHVDAQTGTPVMVDVSHKATSVRVAHAQAVVSLPSELTKYISDQQALGSKANEVVGTKGPVFATAIIAGVMAAKKTADLIPFCHPVALEDCKITITPQISLTSSTQPTRSTLTVDCIVKTTHKTGVEMEAMVGVTNAAMCIYDMLKAVSHDIIISDVKLMSKTGGKSDFHRNRNDQA